MHNFGSNTFIFKEMTQILYFSPMSQCDTCTHMYTHTLQLVSQISRFVSKTQGAHTSLSKEKAILIIIALSIFLLYKI